MEDYPVRVNVMQRSGRKFFECWWINPVTGLKKTRSTKQTRRREAERFAAKLEDGLNAGEFVVRQISWSEFRNEYETTVFPSQKPRTQETTKSTLKALEELCHPARASSIDEEMIRQFTNAIRARVGSEFSVARHLRELRKVLRWGEEAKLLRRCPKIRLPKAKGRRGRGITHEEFQLMLGAVDKVSLLQAHQVAAYAFFLKGLYWGGLRLRESLLLDWNDETHLCVDMDRRRPMFRIQATNDKAGKYRIFPMAPEFAELLMNVPPEQRVGRVFKLPSSLKVGFHQSDRAKRVISSIGEAAKVKVGGSDVNPKFASAHDLRRAFGVRWSRRVLPPVLMELMRHADIHTTMQFYVGQNADRCADDAWDAYERAGREQPTPEMRTGQFPHL